MRLLPIRKISRQSKRLALFLTFVQDMSMPIPLSCEGTPLSLDRLGMSFSFCVGLIQQNVSDASAKVMTLLSFMMGVFF